MDADGGRALFSGDESTDDDDTKRTIVLVGYYVVNPTTATWLLPPNL
jgi:hypothetical protein